MRACFVCSCVAALSAVAMFGCRREEEEVQCGDVPCVDDDVDTYTCGFDGGTDFEMQHDSEGWLHNVRKVCVDADACTRAKAACQSTGRTCGCSFREPEKLWWEFSDPEGGGCYCPAQLCDLSSLDSGDTNAFVTECLGQTQRSEALSEGQPVAQPEGQLKAQSEAVDVV